MTIAPRTPPKNWQNPDWEDGGIIDIIKALLFPPYVIVEDPRPWPPPPGHVMYANSGPSSGQPPVLSGRVNRTVIKGGVVVNEPPADPEPDPTEPPDPTDPYPEPEPEPPQGPDPEIIRGILNEFGNKIIDAAALLAQELSAQQDREHLFQLAQQQEDTMRQFLLQNQMQEASGKTGEILGAVQQSIGKIYQQTQENLQQALEANQKAAQSKPGFLRSLTQNVRPLLTQPTPQPNYPQSEVYTPQQPSIGAELSYDPLRPSKANLPFIQEDQAAIQHNLSYAQKPMTMNEMKKAMADEQRRLELARQQQQFTQQQIRTLAEQERLAKLQRLEIQQRMAGGSLFTQPLALPNQYGELDRGPKSHLPPRHVKSWTPKQAYSHWIDGGGEPIEVPFKSINFKNGNFRLDSKFQQEINKLIQESKKLNHILIKDIELKNQQFEFRDPLTQEYSVYGTISVNPKGEITVDPQGNWQFDGELRPSVITLTKDKSFKGDIFNFDPSRHRNLAAEAVTSAMHTLPGVSYLIHFKGEPAHIFLRSNPKLIYD